MSITFTCEDLGAFKRTLKAALLATDKYNLPILSALHLYRDGERLVVEATDRYRILRAFIPGQWEGDEFDGCVLDKRVARLIIRDATAANIKMRLPARLKFNGVEMSYCVGLETTTSSRPFVDGTYPKIGQLIDNAEKNREPVAEFAMSPNLLADLCAMQPPLGMPLKLASSGGANRPFYSEWEDGDVRVQHILMPVRWSE